ncbi:wall-associated receptor kinase-like 3 isoform X2 [Argentina anserina]|uniref:wall-associated receptor kinase-like 3 isoform X2 n=1 Tax=Argentina anserina TaxID=57926 RepID=UPI0021767BD2|nr:wall-associated receptor kinase-like 3 isoform X2 [Potentilla anserina]
MPSIVIFMFILVLYMWHLVPTSSSSSLDSAWPIAKPNCETHCGNISIPYPFGIGPNKGCYYDEWFEIECASSSTGSHKPSLRHTQPKLEVLNISIEGTLLINNPATFFYYKGNRTRQLAPDMTAGPFIYSQTYNSFIAMSCGFSMRSEDEREVLDQCFTDCFDGTINSCQATLSPYLTLITTKKHNNETDEQSTYYNCAFLADQTWFRNLNFLNTTMRLTYDRFANPSRLEASMGMIPVVLDWRIRLYDTGSYFTIFKGFIGSHSSNNDLRPYCDATSSSYNNVERLDCSCVCPWGFEGNPYLLQPCQDVDECKGSNQCLSRGDTCENFVGGYRCYSNVTGDTCDYFGDRHGVAINSSCYVNSSPIARMDNNHNIRTIFLDLGAGIGLLLLLIGSWVVYRVVNKRKIIRRKKMFFKRNGGLLLEQQLSSGEVNVEKIKLFESDELEKSTDNYNSDRIIGQGAQGIVYKGMLADGRIVAVKRSKIIDEGKLTEFINEVVILSQINHRNVVQLLGCCLETEVPILVYEFIPNGTLSGYIREQNKEFPLTWRMRLRIATEIAGALSYLHCAAAFPIYHRDIKSSNILLDEKYRAKVADFGISRSIAIDQTHLTTLVHGTFGYLDPEYFQSSQFTDKSDVYSFGVVLIELLTGEKPISAVTRPQEEEYRSLASKFIVSMQKGTLFDILDERVRKEGNGTDIRAVANLARRCLDLNGRNRPTMREVTIELEVIQVLPENTSSAKYDEGFENSEHDSFKLWDVASSSSDPLPMVFRVHPYRSINNQPLRPGEVTLF